MCRRMHHVVHDTPVLWDACEILVEAGHTAYLCGLRSRAFRLLFIYTPPSRTQDVPCSFPSSPLTVRFSTCFADGTEGLDFRDHLTGGASLSTWT